MKTLIGFAALIIALSLAQFLINLDIKNCPVPVLDPYRVTLYDNEKCAIYTERWRGAPMYALFCENGSIYFTRDWLYTIGEPK